MSKDEAEKIIRSWLESKMVWHLDNSAYNQIELDNARKVLGDVETEKIIKEVTDLWKD
jgi:hypothetical protein